MLYQLSYEDSIYCSLRSRRIKGKRVGEEEENSGKKKRWSGMRGASCLRTITSLSLAFDFWRNTSTLSEFMGYVDFTDCPEISSEHSSVSGN